MCDVIREGGGGGGGSMGVVAAAALRGSVGVGIITRIGVEGATNSGGEGVELVAAELEEEGAEGDDDIFSGGGGEANVPTHDIPVDLVDAMMLTTTLYCVLTVIALLRAGVPAAHPPPWGSTVMTSVDHR